MSDTQRKFSIDRRGEFYCLEGIVNEHASFKKFEPKEKLIKFDLSGISYINSIGCKTWIQFFDTLKDREVEFHRVSTAMMTGISMLPGLLPPSGGRDSIKSFKLPFCCVSCDHDNEAVVTPAELQVIQDSVFTKLTSCSQCGNPSTLTEANSEFLYLYVYEVVDD